MTPMYVFQFLGESQLLQALANPVELFGVVAVEFRLGESVIAPPVLARLVCICAAVAQV